MSDKAHERTLAYASATGGYGMAVTLAIGRLKHGVDADAVIEDLISKQKQIEHDLKAALDAANVEAG